MSESGKASNLQAALMIAGFVILFVMAAGALYRANPKPLHAPASTPVPQLMPTTEIAEGIHNLRVQGGWVVFSDRWGVFVPSQIAPVQTR